MSQVIRTRKVKTNRLLARKQMVVDIIHPGSANISREELREKLAGMYKTTKERVIVFGFKTAYGGGRTTGFGLVYDTLADLERYEPHYRLCRFGHSTRVEKSRKQRKERKNRSLKYRGLAKVNARGGN
eukprot:TRINITY_DN18_c0_g2_i1.p1 TRINITY_DN18_c0_g2~~TRINITY_DN18_c0_g2_i1.p1  ORF type:complete len:128 (-),score=31.67 TRINITY_DN18_c0_g2_i1:45-428(-)